MDLSKCRLCFEKEGITSLFNRSEKSIIFTKIRYCCTNLKINENDGLPARICDNCESELTTVHQFILKCEATDRNLWNMFQNSASITCLHIAHPKVKIKEIDDEHLQDADASDPIVNSDQDELVQPEDEITKSKGSICSTSDLKNEKHVVLNKHTKPHAVLPHTCPHCGSKYKEKTGLSRHIYRIHSKENRQRNFICEMCGKAFFTKYEVKIHMRIHTGETPFSCSDCPKKFSQISSMYRHRMRHHTSDKPFKCSKCIKRFCTKEEMTCHLQSHTDEKKFSCTICRTPFKYRNNLRKHMLVHANPNNFICNYCGKTFNQKANMKLHIDSQHSAKSGYCNVCSKDVPNIEVHSWRHTGQRPLKCELCASSFFDSKSLARHVNYRHKNIKKYICLYEGCTMTFPSRSMMDFHTAKLHKTTIPYPCDKCSRGFYRKNDIARHKIATHKERP